MIDLLPCVATMPLIDHHCHAVRTDDLDRNTFESLLTEADAVSPFGTSLFDSLIGLAVRRWCAPVLDLPAHAPADSYLARRLELGAAEVNRRFLRATGISRFLIDTGLPGTQLTTGAEFASFADAPVGEVVRLEWIAEQVATSGVTAAAFADTVAEELATRARYAVGWKTIVAYRFGLALSPERPTPAQVRDAAGEWLTAINEGTPARLTNDVLHRHLIWTAIDLRLPVQFHVGYGDADVNLHQADPLLLTDFLRASSHAGVPVVLLHNYPFHRHAAYLTQVFPHVFLDIGLAVHNVGFRASAIIAETLELAPFGKVLFATDGFALAETHYLGTVLFRQGLSDFLTNDAFTTDDAERICHLIGAANAGRVYQL
jgi:predicted TIM-barrel fold metal-dependent hydrolase